MPKVTLDHLLLGVRDLHLGMQEFADLTGMKPVFGGIHPTIGTQNALVSLGPGRYLEIIAPQDPEQHVAGPFGGFDGLENLSVFGWSLGTDDLTKVQSTLAKLGIRHSGSQPGSRQTGSGSTLQWTTTFISWRRNSFSIHPFFIQWHPSSRHPSLSTPKGCQLQEYRVCKNGNDQASELLDNLQPAATFKAAPQIPSGELLGFRLETPKGIVNFEIGDYRIEVI